MRSGCEIQEDRMKKITVAGNSLADIIKRIDAYPNKGMLSKISEVIPSVGGCVPNTGITLKKLAPDELDVSAISRVGKDENGKFIVDTLRGYGLDTEPEFWILAVCVGICQGGIQALSRSYFGKLVPKDESSEYFGFFDVFGKFADFFGPLILAACAYFLHSSKYGVLSLIVLFVIGFILITISEKYKKD